MNLPTKYQKLLQKLCGVERATVSYLDHLRLGVQQPSSLQHQRHAKLKLKLVNRFLGQLDYVLAKHRKDAEQITRMRDCICLRCDSEQFILIPNAVIEQHYNGAELFVTSPGIVCANCGWITVNIDQVDALIRNTKAAYAKQKK